MTLLYNTIQTAQLFCHFEGYVKYCSGYQYCNRLSTNSNCCCNGCVPLASVIWYISRPTLFFFLPPVAQPLFLQYQSLLELDFNKNWNRVSQPCVKWLIIWAVQGMSELLQRQILEPNASTSRSHLIDESIRNSQPAFCITAAFTLLPVQKVYYTTIRLVLQFCCTVYQQTATELQLQPTTALLRPHSLAYSNEWIWTLIARCKH